MLDRTTFRCLIAAHLGFDPQPWVEVLARQSRKDAAPYQHPRLSAVALGNKDYEPLIVNIVRLSVLPAQER